MTHAEELAGHIKMQNGVITFYERQVKRLNQLVADQAELIQWMDDRHEGFYQSDAWFELRQRALDTYGAICMNCGDTPANGAIIQVDHIKAKSRHPALALVFENMQVLCRPCNMGKGTKEKDFRPQRKKAKRTGPVHVSAAFGGAAK